MSRPDASNNDPQIRGLLCGRQPDIFASEDPDTALFLTTAQSVESRFRKPEPFPQVKRPIYAKSPSPPPVDDVPHYTKLMKSLKADKELTDRLSDLVDLYDRSKVTKAIAHEQKTEEEFLQPLEKRFKKQMVGRNYQQFRLAKMAALHDLDHGTRTSQTVQIPQIVVSTRGLHDPANKYAEHRDQERKFEKKIAALSGHPIVETPKPQRETMDYGHLEMQTETRFFDGDNRPKGKKFFNRTLHSVSAPTFGGV